MKKISAPPISLWALALGATGFVTGFFGPMVLNPQANQGPLLGLLITGPLGAAAGAILGIVFMYLPISPKHKTTSLLTICVVGGLSILYFCLPLPKVLAYIVDGTVTGCEMPSNRIGQAIKEWDERIANAKSSTPRAGWKEDVERMLRDEGVVLSIDVTRKASLLEHRKPWDFGRTSISSWNTNPDSKYYFAHFAGSDCASYGKVGFPLYVATGQGSGTWPPSELSNFLSLAMIEPVPAAHASKLR